MFPFTHTFAGRPATFIASRFTFNFQLLLFQLSTGLMPKGKRSTIAPGRLCELAAKEVVYVITCGIDECVCDCKDDRCERGFFSLFLQAINGIEFAARNGVAYHIDFGNRRYCYSDQERENPNFWNYYFEQPIQRISNENRQALNRFHELYPILIWDRAYFRKMNRYVRQLNFREGVRKHIEKAVGLLHNKNVLGVHVRCTDHRKEIRPVDLASYFGVIDKQIHRFDKLFLATDDTRTLELFRRRYDKKVCANDVIRSADSVGVHRNPEIRARQRLGLDVLADCCCLAACNEVTLTFSNVSYAALLFNPELPYTLLEKPSTKWKRIKTLIVYFMDKWGIRKW
jgi:hypothetical protein